LKDTNLNSVLIQASFSNWLNFKKLITVIGNGGAKVLKGKIACS